jgi:hypothetical protein
MGDNTVLVEMSRDEWWALQRVGDKVFEYLRACEFIRELTRQFKAIDD